MKKRVLAALLALVMVFGIVPMTAAISEPEFEVTVTEDENKLEVAIAAKTDASMSAFGFYLTYPTDKVTLVETQEQYEEDEDYIKYFGTGAKKVAPEIKLSSGEIHYGASATKVYDFTAGHQFFVAHFEIKDGAEGKMQFALTYLGFKSGELERSYTVDNGDTLPSKTYVPPHDHVFTNYVYNNDATCSFNGTETAKCDICEDETDTRNAEGTANLTDHTPDGETDCTKASYCTECHQVIREAGEHSWNAGVVTKDPTCTEKGEKTFTCTVCGATKKEDVDPLGHSFTNYVSNNDATCKDDGTKTAKCDRCDVTDTVTDVDSHLNVAHTLVYSASGNTLYETCSVCDHGAGNSVWGAVTVESPSYPFTGEAIEPAKFDYSAGWHGGELTVVYENNVNVGTATAMISPNGETEPATITFEITKAPAPALAASATQTLLCSDIVTGEKVYTFALNSIIAGIPSNAGTVTYQATDGTYGTSAVDGATLTYTVSTAQAAKTTDSITVTVESTNYETATVTVNFEFKNKVGVSDKLSLYKVEVEGVEVVVGGGQYDFLVLEPVVLYNGEITEEIKNATTIVYTDVNSNTYTELTEKTPAGTYTFVATYEDNIPDTVNPEIPGHIGTISGELEITKGWPQLGVFGSPDKEYDGAAATITVDNGDEIIDGCEYYYSAENTPGITWYAVDGEGAKTKLDAAPVDVGTYNVEVSLAESANYQAAAIDVDFEITPKPVTITVNDATKEYGTEDPAFTYTVEPALIANDDLGVITVVRTEADKDKENYGTVELTATYTIENANYVVNIVNGKMSITKTQPTLAQVTKFDSIKKTYNNVAVVAELAAAEGVEGLGKITVKYQLGEAAATTKAPVNAGEYTVIASIAEGANYAAKDLVVGTITIDKAERSFVNLPDGVVYADPAADLALKLAEGADLDKSAKVIYTSYGPVTVNGNGEITANGNGKAVVTVAIAGTDNYLPFEELPIYVYAVVDPVLGVKVTTGTQTATLDGGKIVLNGEKTDYVVELVLISDNYTQETSGKTITVKRGAAVIATYEIDDSALVDLSEVEDLDAISASVTAKGVDATTDTKELLNSTIAQIPQQEIKDTKKAIEADENAQEGDTLTVTVEVKLDITQTAVDDVNKTLTLDLKPTIEITAKSDNSAVADVTTTKVVSELDAPIEVKINISGLGFTPTYVRATHGTDDIEYLPVTIDGDWAIFYPQRFSTFELIQDDSETTISFQKNDTSVQVLTFNAFDVKSGTAFPTDTKSGYSFNGWTFEGVEGTYTNLSAELMAQLGATATAKAEFKPVGSPGGAASTTTSKLTAAEAKNGTVSVNANNATAGATITVTAKPDAGYKIAAIKATTASGKAVEVKETNGIYTFTMPDEDVTVSAEFVEADAEKVFEDVPTNAYYAKAVEWAVEKGITTGTTATTFSPNASCTRAQMVTFLWRAAGAPETEVSTAFTDVKGDAYYAQAVAWALDNGITNGKGKGLFDPNGTVTRAESITMLFRYAKGTANANVKSGFTDVDAYAYYFNAVDWAVNNEITNGTTATTFSPNADCVRAQIVTFLFRLLGDK